MACSSGEFFWNQASSDLGIEVIAPFEASLLDGTILNVLALVKNFGAKNGMLVASDYDELKPHIQKIIDSEYGYATNVGRGHYNRVSMVDVLKDWGWTGPEHQRPSWCSEASS
jgi:hypothetical protein